MSQEILKEFYNFNENDSKYFLMPIAIIPFGPKKKKLYKANNKSEFLKIQKKLLHALNSMKNKYGINYTLNKSSYLKTSDKKFNALLSKSKYVSYFDIRSFKVLAFIFNTDEIVFVVRNNVPFVNDCMEQLYLNWLKDKYSYITGELKDALQFFYRMYKFKSKRLVTHKRYNNVQYSYAYFIVYTNADNSTAIENYRTSILDPSQVIYNHEEIKNIDGEMIKQRITNSKNNNINFDIEKRSDYRVYFSWSTGLIEGKFELLDFFEYILIEVDLQNNWNRICKLTQYYQDRNKKISLFNEKKLADLEMFTVMLNSLNEAGDSERLLNIKDNIIKSSRIFNLIEEYKYRFSLYQQLNSKYISIVAMIISFVTLIITVIFNVLKK